MKGGRWTGKGETDLVQEGVRVGDDVVTRGDELARLEATGIERLRLVVVGVVGGQEGRTELAEGRAAREVVPEVTLLDD